MINKFKEKDISKEPMFFLSCLLFLIVCLSLIVKSTQFWLSLNKHLTQNIELEKFKQIDHSARVQVDLSDSVFRISHYSFQQQVINIDFNNLPNNNLVRRIFSDQYGKFNIQLVEKNYNQSNVLIIEKCIFWGQQCKTLGYIEFLRQSRTQLKKLWNLDKTDGYTIIARTNIKLPNLENIQINTNSYIQPIKKDMPDFNQYKNFDNSTLFTDDLSSAIAIAHYMWQRNPKLGPHNSREPFKLDPLTRLDLSAKDDWSIQCADFAYIFINIAAYSSRVQGVRSAKLFQYYPNFKDLIPHSHAGVEIFSISKNGWVYFDPWFGLVFKRKDSFLSVSEIAAMTQQERRSIEVIHVFKNRPNPFKKISYSETIPTDGYWGYFGTVEVGMNEKQ